MEVLIILVTISLALLGGALAFLFKSVHDGDYDHGDRLSLLPLEEDGGGDVRQDDDVPRSMRRDA